MAEEGRLTSVPCVKGEPVPKFYTGADSAARTVLVAEKVPRRLYGPPGGCNGGIVDCLFKSESAAA